MTARDPARFGLVFVPGERARGLESEAFMGGGTPPVETPAMARETATATPA